MQRLHLGPEILSPTSGTLHTHPKNPDPPPPPSFRSVRLRPAPPPRPPPRPTRGISIRVRSRPGDRGMEVEKVLEVGDRGMEVEKVPVVGDRGMEVEKVPVVGDRGMEVEKVLEVRPRFVWDRRPRPNGGRRRPRGRYGFYKHAPVVSRGSYPLPAKAPLTAPRLDEFPLILFNTSPPTGNPLIDSKLGRISVLYGCAARIRLLICARADMMMTSGVYLAETQEYWKRHDNILKVVEALREELLSEDGVEVPPVPERLYQKF